MLNTKLNPEDFNYHKEIEVRFRDTDQVGHVNNAVYSSYLELARIGYSHNLGFTLDGNQEFSFMLIETHVRFMAAAMFGDHVIVHVRAREFKKMQFAFEYIITRKSSGERLCAAKSLQVGLDVQKQRACSLHPDFLAKVKDFEGL